MSPAYISLPCFTPLNVISLPLSRSPNISLSLSLSYSPILWVAEYQLVEYIDGSSVPVCLTQAIGVSTVGFFLMTISVFFVLPFLMLIVLYSIIARNLISNQGAMLRARPTKPELSLKARKQVVLMLGAVVISFFICLLPFRLLTLWIILSTDQALHDMGLARYYSLLYFCRIMLYLNSAMNPILYNLMSTKFRKGFGRLCHDVGQMLWQLLTLGSRRRNASESRGQQSTGSGTNTNSSNTTAATNSSILSRSSNRRSSEEITRTRLKIELHLPCGSELEAMAMLQHSTLRSKRRPKQQISFDEDTGQAVAAAEAMVEGNKGAVARAV